MQCSTGNVFQELQQQGTTSQEGESAAEGRAQAGGGRGGDRRVPPSPSLETSSSFFPEDSPHTQSPTPSFFREAAGSSRYQGSQDPRGRRGSLIDAQSTSEASRGSTTRIRPAAGSRPAGTPFGPSTGETVPSQLLGGRAGTDADVFVNSQLSNYALEYEAPKAMLRKTTATQQLRQISDHDNSVRRQTKLLPPGSSDNSPPHTPSPGESSSTPSTSSKKSNASSFAYKLRDNREDRRLFKKRSKPSQHLKEQPSVEKQTPKPKHSASFYRPRVIEESAVPIPSGSSTSGGLIPAVRNQVITAATSPGVTPARNADPSQLDQPNKSTISPSSLAAKRLGPLGLPSSLDIPPSALSRSRREVDTSSSSPTHSRDSSQDLQHTSHGHHHGRSTESSSSVVHKRWYEYNTPPESEPRTPFDSLNRHRDHYFRTFGTDTMYGKEAPPSTVSPHPGSAPKHIQFVEPSPSPAMQVSPSESSVSVKTTRKHDNVLKLLHSGPVGNSTPESASSHRSDSSSPSRGTPDIKISTPQLANSRRRSNTGSDLPPYFAQPSQSRASSECTPMSPASALSTHWEDVVAESHQVGHAKDSSEPLSPLTVPQSPIRPKPKRTAGESRLSQTSRDIAEESVIVAAVPSGAVTGPQPKYKSAMGEEYYKTSLTSPGSPSFLPSEMKRINTPPQKETLGGFKGFFFDKRSIPVNTDAESPESATLKRRRPILHKTSLQALLPKLSTSKLKWKAPQQNRAEPKVAESPLEVTAFHQTPYSQRYGDTRRAKMSLIRSYVEETLKDDDDDESASFSFELNVPEHLPGSPLCPLSPKHESGGKAICPIHRRKRTSVAGGKNLTKKTTAKPEPRIVYESESPGDVTTPEGLAESRRGGS